VNAWGTTFQSIALDREAYLRLIGARLLAARVSDPNFSPPATIEAEARDLMAGYETEMQSEVNCAGNSTRLWNASQLITAGDRCAGTLGAHSRSRTF
jgi:hypothetical protein